MRQKTTFLQYLLLILVISGLFPVLTLFSQQIPHPSLIQKFDDQVGTLTNTGSPGTELIEKRTPYTQHFLNPDGSIMAFLYSVPSSYQPEVVTQIQTPAPRPADESTPGVTYRGYSYWHHNDGYLKQSSTSMQIGHDFDFWNEEWRAWTEWDISSIPDIAIISYVGVQLTISGRNSTCEFQNAQVCFFSITSRPSVTTGAQTLFDDAADGTQYDWPQGYSVSSNGVYPSASDYIKLGGSAISDLGDSRSMDWFAIGFTDFFDGGTENWDDEGVIISSVTLKVIYYLDGDDGYEDNDLSLWAANLAIDQAYSLRCFDQDYFSITVENASQLLQVVLTCNATYGELEVTIYDPAGIKVANQSSTDEIRAEYCVAPGKNGTYIFSVVGVSGERNLYSLIVHVTPATCPIDLGILIPYFVLAVVLLVIIGGIVSAAKKVKPSYPSKNDVIPVQTFPPLNQPPVGASLVEHPSAQQLPPSTLPSGPGVQDLQWNTQESTHPPPPLSPETIKFCPHCGAELILDDTICKHCGISIT